MDLKKVTKDNYREIETKFKLSIEPLFIDIQKYKLEISLLKKEVKKL
jgi:hypothetical protein